MKFFENKRKFFVTAFLSCIVLLTGTQAFAQQITVTGTVTGDGEPMPGVTVVVKGTTNAVVSGAGGRYTISVPDGNAVLQYSYLGYLPQEVTVGTRRVIDIVLETDIQSMEQVVVVGYGVQRKVNMTGAVSTVSTSALQDRPVTSLSTALAGLSAGLNVSQNAGDRPGHEGAKLRIRGTGTLNNSAPLIVVDGVTGAGINDINPADVESISVMKDAASSAIYGSRAANGVILITTRKGRAGQATLSYQGSVTAQTPAFKYDIVSNYADYMTYMNESRTNNGSPSHYSQANITAWRAAEKNQNGMSTFGDVTVPNWQAYPNTDWQDVFFKTGWMQNHTVSASGGERTVRYYLSGQFQNNPGIVEHADYERFGARANLEADVKPWMTVGTNISGYVATANTNTIAIENGAGDAVFGGAMGTTPGMLLRHPDGRLGAPNNSEDPAGAGNNNPFRRMNFYKHHVRTKWYDFKPRFYAIVRPFEGFSVEGSYSYRYYYYTRPRLLQDADIYNFQTNTVARYGVVRTYNDVRNEKSFRHEMNAIARYAFETGRLGVDIMAGASQERYRWEYENLRKYDASILLDAMDAFPADPAVAGNYDEWAMRSYFGRINLDWDDKYLLEANLRADGSSRFLSGKNRWGVFPSFSAGWRISEEEFMNDISWLSSLKLRASWGELGNNDVGSNYAYSAFYAQSNYILNSAIATGYARLNLADPSVTWETTKVTNVGVDFALLDNRLNGSFEFFNKSTVGILVSLPVPLVHGTSGIPRQNAATVRNRGMELDLEWRDRVGNVNYRVAGNIAYVKNEVTRFQGDVYALSGVNMIREGLPINTLYLYEVDRIVQTDADLAAVNALVTQNPTYFSGSFRKPEKGDILYKDSNGDGKLDTGDQVNVGWGQDPQITWGLTLGADWKGIDLVALFQGVGRWKGIMHDQYYRFVTDPGSSLNSNIAEGAWREGRTDAVYPRLLPGSNGKNEIQSTAYVFDRTYVRLKNVQLGYTIPQNITRKMAMERVRVYCSIENAFTISKWPGMDPEMNTGNSASYPLLKMYSFGLDLTF